MSSLLEKSAGLLAVYSIALQAVLWGFVPVNHFDIDPFAIICSAENSGGQKHSPPQHRGDCDACLPACGSSPALAPLSVAFLPPQFAAGPTHPPLLPQAPPLRSRHDPQGPRAPPSILI